MSAGLPWRPRLGLTLHSRLFAVAVPEGDFEAFKRMSGRDVHFPLESSSQNGKLIDPL
jgi:hypothetical protein